MAIFLLMERDEVCSLKNTHGDFCPATLSWFCLTPQERPKSAVFPAEVKSKMSVEEQNERIRRNLSNSVRDKRRSLNLSSSQQLDGAKPSYRVVSLSDKCMITFSGQNKPTMCVVTVDMLL